MTVSQKELKDKFTYNKNTGEFFFNYDSGKKKAGDISNYVNNHGYCLINIKDRQYPAHKLAWLYEYGELPYDQIDHINHDRSDNRISNLRIVTNRENHLNTKLRTDNTSGHVGVEWLKTINKWRARIYLHGKMKHIGVFDRKDDAMAARKLASIKHGFHPNHGSA